MSEYIRKSDNVTVLMYHLVFPAKYRRAVFEEQVDEELKEICVDLEKRYQLKFIEIGTEYVKDQGNEYMKLHEDRQLALF